MGLAASTDLFTKIAHDVYFGSRVPSAAHLAAGDSAQCLVLSQARVEVSPSAEDLVPCHPKHGSSDTWCIQRCLVSTINEIPKNDGILRVVAISDTHCKQEFLHRRVPDGDVLVHCGDVLMSSVRFSDGENRRRAIAFNVWLGTLPHEHKIVVPGNHDGFLQRLGVEKAQRLLSNATYLVDAGVQIRGLQFWGTPVSWGHSRNDAFQQHHDETHVSKIPKNVDVLISHGFPFERLDSFRRKIMSVQPMVHFCGHWHSGSGVHFWSNICTVNCSLLNGKYRLKHHPAVVHLPAGRNGHPSCL